MQDSAGVRHDSTVAEAQAKTLNAPAMSLVASVVLTRDSSTTVKGNTAAHSAIDAMKAQASGVSEAIEAMVKNLGTIDANFTVADQSGR